MDSYSIAFFVVFGISLYLKTISDYFKPLPLCNAHHSVSCGYRNTEIWKYSNTEIQKYISLLLMEAPSCVQRPSFGLLRIIKLGEEQTLFPTNNNALRQCEMGIALWWSSLNVFVFVFVYVFAGIINVGRRTNFIPH